MIWGPKRWRPAILAVVFVGVAALTSFAGVALSSTQTSVAAAPHSNSNGTPSGGIALSTSASNPVGATVAFENQVLGYRLTLPAEYRRSNSTMVAGAGGSGSLLGHDTYTLRSEADETAECQHDGSETPASSSAAYFDVAVYSDTGVSAATWAAASPFKDSSRVVEAATVNGYDSARFVEGGKTAVIVMHANRRLYVLVPGMWPSPHALDDIAASFTATAPQLPPTPTPTPAPLESSRKVGEGLAAAFTAHDADGVARLMAPCRIAITTLIDGVSPGGVQIRSSSAFIAGLRDRFGRGDLTVSVDPLPQVEIVAGTPSYFVRSTWRDPDRTTEIDLFFAEVGGQWQWVAARHHYQRTELTRKGTCIPLRVPWVPDARC